MPSQSQRTLSSCLLLSRDVAKCNGSVTRSCSGSVQMLSQGGMQSCGKRIKQDCWQQKGDLCILIWTVNLLCHISWETKQNAVTAMTLKLCCNNDFVEQITILYWLFYALSNNQQFMKTTFCKYGPRFLSGDCQDWQQGSVIAFPVSPHPPGASTCLPYPGPQVARRPHPSSSYGAHDTAYEIQWRRGEVKILQAEHKLNQRRCLNETEHGRCGGMEWDSVWEQGHLYFSLVFVIDQRCHKSHCHWESLQLRMINRKCR